MASGIHLWTWDARPYPVFPSAIDVWSDGPNWETGHWLTGRLGSSPLDGLIAAILDDSGADNFDAAARRGTRTATSIDRPMAPRAAIEPLAQVYAFDAAEVGRQARLPAARRRACSRARPKTISCCRIVARRCGSTRAQETELPREVSIGFTDGRHRTIVARPRPRAAWSAARRARAHADIAVVTNDSAAKRRADIWLQDLWAGRESAEFALPPRFSRSLPAICCTDGARPPPAARSAGNRGYRRAAPSRRARSIRKCSICPCRRRAGRRLPCRRRSGRCTRCCSICRRSMPTTRRC